MNFNLATLLPLVSTEKAAAPQPAVLPASTEQVRLRFAEDILSPVKTEVDPRKKKKKKTASGKEGEEDIKARRSRRGGVDYSLDEDEEF